MSLERKNSFFSLNRDGFLANTDLLDVIETVTPELLRALLPYVPMGERQCFNKYRQQPGGWTEFKKRFLEQEQELRYSNERNKYAQQLNVPYGKGQKNVNRVLKKKK